MSEPEQGSPEPRNPSAAAWTLPKMRGPLVSGRRGGDAADAGRTQQEAYDAGFAQGRADGAAAGQAEFAARNAALAERIARFDEILACLSRPLDELDPEVETLLSTLAIAIARQVVRRELRLDPAQVIAVIRETVGLLPAAARDVRVHLHPDDAAVVREKLAAPGGERAWTIVEDPVLARGGCRVTTDTAQIDARLESRLAAVAASVLGEDRAGGARESRDGERADDGAST